MNPSCLSSLYRPFLYFLVFLFVRHKGLWLALTVIINRKHPKECLILLLLCLSLSLQGIRFINHSHIGLLFSSEDGRDKICALQCAYIYNLPDTFQEGDIIVYETDNVISYNASATNDYAKDIFYKGDIKTYNAILHLPLPSLNIRRNTIDSAAKRLLYGESDNNTDEEIYYLGFGLTALLRFLHRHQKYRLSYAVWIVHVLCFGYRPEVFILLIQLICMQKKITPKFQFLWMFCPIILWNPFYLFRKTVQLQLCFRIFALFETHLSFKSFSLWIQSLMFNQIDLLRPFLYPIYRVISVYFYAIAFISVFNPVFLNVLNISLRIYTKIFSLLRWNIKGNLGICSLLFLVWIKAFPKKQTSVQIILLSLMLIIRLQTPFVSLTFVDVGQGDAVYFEDRIRNINFLIDTGSRYAYPKLQSFLYAEGVNEIDYLILTHGDEDHAGNLENIRQNFRIGQIINDAESIISDSFYLSSFQMPDFPDSNNNSLIHLLIIDGRYFLFTGDIEKEAEKIFVRNYSPLDIDVLKVAHHGSSNSSSLEFLSELSPEISIISTDGKYHHPHQSTLNCLNIIGSKIISTREEGNIRFVFLRLFDIVQSDKGLLILPKKIH